MGKSLNDHRFNLNDRYDKSTYLTKVPRPKAIIDFSKPSKRSSDLMLQGGDERVDLGGKSCNFIDQGKAEKVVQKRLNFGIPNFKRTTTRNVMFGNLYKHSMDLTPDHYDSLKVAQKTVQHTKRKIKPYVDMKK